MTVKKYNSNAERQAAYRKRKKYDKLTRDVYEASGNPPIPTDEQIEDIYKFAKKKQEDFDEKQLSYFPKIDPELQSLVGIVKEKTFKNALEKMRTTEVTLEIERSLAKIDSGTTNNTSYIERVLNDFYRALEEIGYL